MTAAGAACNVKVYAEPGAAVDRGRKAGPGH